MSENMILFTYALLFGVITVLGLLLARALPMIHDSVARHNLMPLYQYLLQIAGPPAQTGLSVLGDALIERAEGTMTPYDDVIAAKIDEKFAEWAAAIGKADTLPSKPVHVTTDKVDSAAKVSEAG